MKLKRKTKKKKSKRRKTQKGGNSFTVYFKSIKINKQHMNKSITQSQPTVTFIPKNGSKYTIIMWDPDVPEQFKPSWVHWVVCNLENKDQINDKTILSYQGPSPPSGTHEYIFGIFEQNYDIFPKIYERKNFDINSFITTYELKEINRTSMFVSSSN
jgi:phosphatidylethanolamine-binding protein (PEBP) family uncharacterized protein